MRRECPKTTYSPPRQPHRAQRCHIHHLNIILYHTVYRAQTRSALEKQERVSGTWLWLRKWFGDGNAKDHLDFVAMGAAVRYMPHPAPQDSAAPLAAATPVQSPF